MSAHFDTDHMYTYMKGYCMGKGWPDAVSALSFAREQHRDQTRKDGQPYLCHPLAMACHAGQTVGQVRQRQHHGRRLHPVQNAGLRP